MADHPIKELEEFIAGQPGSWTIRQPSGWSIWIAVRKFPEHNVTLRVWPAQAPTVSTWTVSCLVDDRQELASSPPGPAEVALEVAFVERALGLICALRDCTSRDQATALIREVQGRQLQFIRSVLGLPQGAAEATRNRIVRRLCGSRIDADILSRKTVKW